MLDSFAVIALLNRDPGFENIKHLLLQAQESGLPLLMNEINVGEVFYLTAKRVSWEMAEEFLKSLPALPVELVSNSYADVLEAARIKAQFPISYADAFAVATAIRRNAVIVTGDREFRSVGHLVEIAWL